jgi:hypothetical protein
VFGLFEWRACRSDQALRVAGARRVACFLLASRYFPQTVVTYQRLTSALAIAVENIDETLGRLSKHGAQLVGEVVRYQDSYRLCYIRGPEGLLIGLAQELN